MQQLALIWSHVDRRQSRRAIGGQRGIECRVRKMQFCGDIAIYGSPCWLQWLIRDHGFLSYKFVVRLKNLPEKFSSGQKYPRAPRSADNLVCAVWSMLAGKVQIAGEFPSIPVASALVRPQSPA